MKWECGMMGSEFEKQNRNGKQKSKKEIKNYVKIRKRN